MSCDLAGRGAGGGDPLVGGARLPDGVRGHPHQQGTAYSSLSLSSLELSDTTIYEP